VIRTIWLGFTFLIILAGAGSFRFAFGHFDVANASSIVLPENNRTIGLKIVQDTLTKADQLPPELHAKYPGRDWMLTRILWLSGREPGRNRLGDVDTMRRYIYLHGSPDTAEMGKPGSIGCVRMRNRDIVELFDLVPPYTPVEITE
jgi:hypothetical protein